MFASGWSSHLSWTKMLDTKLLCPIRFNAIRGLSPHGNIPSIFHPSSNSNCWSVIWHRLTRSSMRRCWMCRPLDACLLMICTLSRFKHRFQVMQKSDSGLSYWKTRVWKLMQIVCTSAWSLRLWRNASRNTWTSTIACCPKCAFSPFL